VQNSVHATIRFYAHVDMFSFECLGGGVGVWWIPPSGRVALPGADPKTFASVLLSDVQWGVSRFSPMEFPGAPGVWELRGTRSLGIPAKPNAGSEREPNGVPG
jgi:hypothetical protein